MSNPVLKEIQEQISDFVNAGGEMPPCLESYIRRKIYESLVLYKQRDDIIEFNMFLHDYVIYINSRYQPVIIEKKRYEYLKQRQII